MKERGEGEDRKKKSEGEKVKEKHDNFTQRELAEIKDRKKECRGESDMYSRKRERGGGGR